MIATAISAVTLAMMQLVHPETPIAKPPVVAAILPATKPPPKPEHPYIGVNPGTKQPVTKSALGPTDYAYTPTPGVTSKNVAYYSEGVPCFAKVFYPKGFDPGTSKVPAIVLGQGWAGTHVSIEKYGDAFAGAGFVAMVIDYRGWGNSEGYVRLVSPVNLGGDMSRDENRHQIVKNATVEIKRTKLLARDQQEDYRNAISFVQGEPGVNPDLIGVWGSSFAGGNSVAVAGQDARVKAIAVQIPGIGGNPEGSPPMDLKGDMLKDAIQRARTGQGEEMWTGYSRSLLVDSEQVALNRENNVLFWAKNIGQRPLMVIVAENDELINNTRAGKAAIDLAKGPKEYIVVPGITHFQMYSGNSFKTSSEAAARWFTTYLK